MTFKCFCDVCDRRTVQAAPTGAESDLVLWIHRKREGRKETLRWDHLCPDCREGVAGVLEAFKYGLRFARAREEDTDATPDA